MDSSPISHLAVFLPKSWNVVAMQCVADSTRGLADEVVTWPVYGERYAKKIREFSANFMELAKETVRRREDRFNVLSHGDFWMNNILFRSPDGVRFIDFQMTHFSSVGNDLQQLMASSLMPEVRRNDVDTLLKVTWFPEGCFHCRMRV